MKTSTDFEKIAGYLTVLEEQQAIVTDMINEMAEVKNDAFDAILEAKASLNLATEALKQQLAKLNHIEIQKAHMTHVLSELNAIEHRTAHSMEANAAQFRELARTVPAEISQNIMVTIQQTDIVGAVRQRTDAQMEAIAQQVNQMTERSHGIAKTIKAAEDDLQWRYDRLQRYFWWMIGGAMLSIGIVTGVSANFFFSKDVDRNFNAIASTYRLVEELKTQCHTLTDQLDLLPNNSENLKKK
ncbi:hypothetical protein KKI90_20045 [Xenorhabdus bovienii]|uniref:hypothetical protein n=1 Tax=Xenorhabdus bovienii TaxID=40576 RepID=UPI00237CEF02|nr:hypothetical protein [Xenorhabdus bovienii]MDE1488557.1 hypothetical protein [Xenorhabdus bovienii]MDE1497058.1 hypothetical protein [Xenorhabdus bovienii]MDE9475112.1 hypothetical protein [Xenorhabdus bovienii]MDE9532273.1 hypothetical protein [Xenorhabdus bovienii]